MKVVREKETNNILLMLNEINESDNLKELKANDTDGTVEKHVPVYEIKDNKIFVTVGSTLHPMTDEHYIMLIAQVSKNIISIKKLNPGDEVRAIFEYIKNSKIYAYCNLHGLWKCDVE